LKENEKYPDTLGTVFKQIAENSAMVTYSQKLWELFSGLFRVALSTLFDDFKIEEEFPSYFEVICNALSGLIAFREYETWVNNFPTFGEGAQKVPPS